MWEGIARSDRRGHFEREDDVIIQKKTLYPSMGEAKAPLWRAFLAFAASAGLRHPLAKEAKGGGITCRILSSGQVLLSLSLSTCGEEMGTPASARAEDSPRGLTSGERGRGKYPSKRPLHLRRDE